MDNPTDVVVVIEEFINFNKDDAVSALDDYDDKENDFLIKDFIVYDIS